MSTWIMWWSVAVPMTKREKVRIKFPLLFHGYRKDIQEVCSVDSLIEREKIRKVLFNPPFNYFNRFVTFLQYIMFFFFKNP